MKSLFLILPFLIILISSCNDKVLLKYKANTPVYADYESFRSSVKFEAPRVIKNQGNIYLKDQYLFVVEPEKGIHFIDNSDPSNPVFIGFLRIIGCTGMSVSGNFLYANSYIDLVVIDISSIHQPLEIERMEDVFPQALPAIDNNLKITPIDKNRGVVVGWEVMNVKEEVSEQPVWYNCLGCETTTSNGNGFQSESTGISGSITRFSIIGDRLYVVDGFRLIPFTISNPQELTSATAIPLTRQVETLFPYNNYLFMGTTSGMQIYGTDNPDLPVEISTITHATACDPVVVQGNYAYVTTRMGTTCAGNINQLDIIDISAISNPITVASYPMVNPHGLGIDGNLLFICDGSAGLKIFNSSNPVNSGNQLMQSFSSIQATDIIPRNSVAIVIGEDALYQYSYSDPQNLQLLSTIPIHP